MGLLFFIALLVPIAMYYRRMEKTLRPVENAAMYLFLAILDQNVLAQLTIVFSLYDMTQNKWLIWALFLNRVVTAPLALLIYLNLIVRQHNWAARLGITAAILAVVLTMEYCSVWLGLITYVKWSAWLSPLQWLGHMLLPILFWRWFRRLLRKEALS